MWKTTKMICFESEKLPIFSLFHIYCMWKHMQRFRVKEKSEEKEAKRI